MEGRPAFSDTIKYARTRIQEVYERRLHGPASIGSIFALKNFGWKDTVGYEGSFKVIYPAEWERLEAAAGVRALPKDGPPVAPAIDAG